MISVLSKTLKQIHNIGYFSNLPEPSPRLLSHLIFSSLLEDMVIVPSFDHQFESACDLYNADLVPLIDLMFRTRLFVVRGQFTFVFSINSMANGYGELQLSVPPGAPFSLSLLSELTNPTTEQVLISQQGLLPKLSERAIKL